MEPNHTLGIGRIVHYVLPEEYKNRGECRPAMIVRTWSNQLNPQVRVQLQVFMDGTNDGAKYATRTCQWATSVAYDPTGSEGTWHWPDEHKDSVELQPLPQPEDIAQS